MTPRRAALLGALSAVCLLACDSPKDPAPAAAPSAAPGSAAVFRQAQAVADRLRKVREAAADVRALSEASCPDDAITKELGQAGGRLLAADYDYLARYAVPKIGAKMQGPKEWGFLTTPAIAKLPSPIELESKKAAVDMVYAAKGIEKDYPYVGVIRTTERRWPALSDGGFVAGALSGWVVIVDLETGKRVCQASFTTTMPEDVAVPKTANPQAALRAHLQMRARKALDAAVGRVTRVLSLDLD